MEVATPAAALAGIAGVYALWDLLAVASARGGGGRVTRLVAPGAGARAATRTERRRIAIVAALTLAAGGYLLAGPVAALAVGAGGPALSVRILAWQRLRWRRRLDAGLPTAARAIADALAGGHAIGSALGAAADVPGPAGAEFGRAARSLALGASLEDTLAALGDRARLPTWDAIAAAILLAREIGGDLAALLRTVAEGAEAAARAEASARAAIAQARATARLVGAAPLACGAGLELVRPGTLAAIAGEPLPLLLVSAGAVLGLCGTVVIGRLARGLGR